MTTPAKLYKNAIDLNRYSNSVSKRIIVSYNDLIVDTAQRLSGLDALSAPAKAAKLRGLLRQLKSSLEDWSANSTALSIEELEQLAGVQAGFVESQLKEAIPSKFRDQVRSVEISPRFAEAVATADPTQQRGVTSLSDDLQASVTGAKNIKKITIADGVTMTLPNGQVLKKTFANMAEKEAAFFGQAVKNGFLTGEPIDSIVKRLKGRLMEGDAGPISQILRAGGQSTTRANNQIRTVIRTSVNQIANAASIKTYEANQDITKKYRYTSTLDSRTSAICRALDGTEHFYGKGPIPPQHFNCRSTTVPIIDYKGLGFDPPPSSKVGRPGSDKNIPEGENYGPWLKRQPKKTQEEVLGDQGQVSYFNALSRKYGPDGAIRRFVREDGSEKTIGDLKKAYGDPSKIKTKPKAKPKPKPKTKALTSEEVNATLKKAQAMAKAQEVEAKSIASKAASDKAAAKAQATKKATSEKALNKKGRTADTNYDYDKNWEKLGYEKKAQYRKVKEDVVEWSGNEFEGVRAAQFADARDRGAELNNYERLQTRRLEKGEQRTAGNRARRLEDFIDRAPKYDGTIRRGVAMDTREEVMSTIERYNSGKKNLAIESWTSDEGVSRRFAMGNGDPRPQRMSILVENNSKGAPINGISGFDDEFEVLVPSGVRYEVVEVKEKFVKGNLKGGPATKMDYTDWTVTLREVKD